MAVSASVQEFLRQASIAYSVVPHRSAYTAQEEATLAAEAQIVFNAGTHADAVSMRYQDFATITQPIVGSFAERPVLRNSKTIEWSK